MWQEGDGSHLGMNRRDRGQASLGTRVTHAMATHRQRHSQRPQGVGGDRQAQQEPHSPALLQPTSRNAREARPVSSSRTWPGPPARFTRPRCTHSVTASTGQLYAAQRSGSRPGGRRDRECHGQDLQGAFSQKAGVGKGQGARGWHCPSLHGQEATTYSRSSLCMSSCPAEPVSLPSWVPTAGEKAPQP